MSNNLTGKLFFSDGSNLKKQNHKRCLSERSIKLGFEVPEDLQSLVSNTNTFPSDS